MTKLLNCLLVSLIVVQLSQAQTLNLAVPEIVPSSPDVAALGKFGEIPVSKYTGIPNIGVPIYNLDFDGLEIPIGLSYHAGGIRTNEESGWVGLGWTLTGNATIGRRIRGFGDFSVGSPALDHDGAVGYAYSSDFTFPLSGTEKQTLNQAYLNDYPIDIEPDLFTANIFGQAFKFIIEKKSPESNIINLVPLNDVNFKGTYDLINEVFKIISPQGFEFEFDKREYTTTYHGSGIGTTSAYNNIALRTDADNRRTFQQITGWHLTKITSPRHEELNFAYEDGFQISYHDYSMSNTIGVSLSSTPSVIGAGPFSWGASIAAYENTYLTEIYGDFGSIDFVLINGRNDLAYDTSPYLFQFGITRGNRQPKKLDQIQVRNSQNQLVKTAFLNYSYFNSLQSDGPKFKRLKLDGITVDDQVYSFEYELPNSLPAKDTFNKDFWGFYNGTGNSSHAVPSFARYVYDYYYEIENLVRFQGSNRKSNFNYARAGVLNKINYPTGGFTSFEYESNKAAVNKPINNSTLDYNYAYLSDLPVVGTANYPQTVVGIGQQFTITDETPHILGTYNFSATINLTCSYNCSASTSSSPILKITNVNTNEEQTMFTYYSPGYGSQLITANQSLSPGTYVLSILPYVNAPGNPTVGLNATLDNAFYVEYNGNVQIPDDVQEFEVGGLRIKRIINSDGFQNISVREFDYTMQRYGKIVSSGVLMDQLVYHSKMGFYDYTPESFNQEISISSGPSLMTNPSAQGIHIGYSYVKETFKGSGNGNNGHILSNYHNSANSYVVRHVGTVPASNPANGINSKMELRDVNYGNVYVLGIPPLVYDYKNGSLLSESIFDSLGNEVSRVERDYLDVANSTNNTIKVLYQGSIGGQAVTGGNVLADFAYAVLGRTTLLEEERQYTFSGIDSHLKTTNFLYNNRNLTESVSAITSSSGGSPPVVKIEYKYPFDFATPAYVDLVGKNRVAQPVEVTTYRGQTLVTGGTRTEYQTFTGVGGKSFNEPIRELVYNTESLAFEERLTYTDYDNEGNLLEYLSPDEKRMAFRWGYDNTVPVIKAEEAGNGLDAAIQNALPTGYTSLEQLLDNLDDIATNSSKRSLWSSFNQSLRSQPGMEDAMIYTYTYKPLLGFTSETGPSGLVRYYQYDTNNRLYQVIDQDGHVVNQYEYNYNSTN